ncbi:protein ACCELERATED CELL DEATH 6-like [Impatiens glandulifera]|uniref:protein ACCELERATED CELL DEATH 6-like n=1 Tax=Impatiens glandulifera TaxID=253017 RepID=UPI001FB090FB|nr:protein ACCELERATED CELL DEATH 6-like [Impatiens glandulifera]
MSVPKDPGLLEEEEEISFGSVEAMDPDLYRATKEGDILEFIKSMEICHLDSPVTSCIQLSPQKNTVLHIAANFRHYEIVKLLCKDLPFFVAEKNAKGETAFHIAARFGDQLLLSLLLNSEFRMTVLAERNNEGNTALHEALLNRCEETALMLIDKNLNMLYSVNKEGKSVLYLAAEAGYVSIVKLLMENPVGNCVSAGRFKNKSPVYAAIYGRNIDILRILWEKDECSFLIKCDDEGRNALHFASTTGYLEGVCFLLMKYPSFGYQRDKHGFFPIHIASSKGHIDVIDEMLCQFPDMMELLTLHGQNIIHTAAKHGKAKVVDYMLKKSHLENLLNARDLDGNSPLHLSTIYAHPLVVSSLVRDRSVKAQIQNNNKMTALDIAELHTETIASLRKRLTLLSLRVNVAPKSSHESKTVIRESSDVKKHQHPRLENYNSKINVILLVATFIATVTFTVGFTLPGGYNNSNPEPGIATLLAKVKFQEFIVFDILAFYSSIIVVASLIWVQLGDPGSMYYALKLMVPLLGFSLLMISAAFMAGIYVTVSDLNWLAYLIIFWGSSFVSLVAVFFPLCLLASSNFQFLRHASKVLMILILHVFKIFNDYEETED